VFAGDTRDLGWSRRSLAESSSVLHPQASRPQQKERRRLRRLRHYCSQVASAYPPPAILAMGISRTSVSYYVASHHCVIGPFPMDQRFPPPRHVLERIFVIPSHRVRASSSYSMLHTWSKLNSYSTTTFLARQSLIVTAGYNKTTSSTLTRKG